MRKEHSAVDWSKRPLPKPWLEYAALDVEVLVELRDVIAAELDESGKAEWAEQEFQHLIDHVAPARAWTRGGVRPASTRPRAGAPSPPYASSGRPATRSPSSATPHPGGWSPTRR